MPGRSLLLLAVLPLLACASFMSRVVPRSEPDTRFGTAVAALDRSDFAAATADLSWLVSRCEAGSRGRTALLLFASSELDLRNPHGSPAAAARLAAAYIRLPWIDEREVSIARTLYLMALDRGGAADSAAAEASLPPLASRFDHCDGGGVPEWSLEPPEHPGVTTAERLDRLARLEAELALSADSLADVQARNAAQATRIRELEAEIERVRRLLRGGGGTLPMRP